MRPIRSKSDKGLENRQERFLRGDIKSELALQSKGRRH